MNEAFKMCFGQSGMDTKGENQISSESLILCKGPVPGASVFSPSELHSPQNTFICLAMYLGLDCRREGCSCVNPGLHIPELQTKLY